MNTFIIVNYNDYPSTIHLLNNIKEYDCIKKIVVVDNSSTDASFVNLKKYESKKIDIIRTNSNKGYCYAINFSIRYLVEMYDKCKVIISNADIIIKQEADLITLYSDLDNCSMVGPVINEHGAISRGWKVPSPALDILMNLVVIHRYFRHKYMFYPDSYYNDSLIPVETVSGCFFGVTTDAIRKIGFLDENLFLYYEENVLGYKLKKEGLKTVIDNRVEIIHNHSVSIDKNLSKIKKYKQLKKSQYYFQTRYNHATILDKILLWLTNKLSLIILFFVYLIKDILKG